MNSPRAYDHGGRLEAAVAHLISIGIIAGGIWIVAGTLAAGSPLVWSLAGLVTVAIGSLSLFGQIKVSRG
jgi:uncharacterized membrane protein YiaA